MKIFQHGDSFIVPFITNQYRQLNFQPPLWGWLFLTEALDNIFQMCYTYDNLNRVTGRTIRKLSDHSVISTETFTYDAAGNVTGGSAEPAFVYDSNNRLISYNGNPVTYDADGNMRSNGSLSCTYDSANRLITAGGHTYTYNAEDVRIRNHCEDEDTTYTYDTNCTLSRLLTKTTNGVTTKYVYGLGLIGEESEDGSLGTYHFDSRGSTVAITDETGMITDTFAYDTYGKCTDRTGIRKVIFGYNGRDGVVTEDNGLIYMRARYYSPDMRRFINADVIPGDISNAITLNRYAYANGNPVSNVDPFGLSAGWFNNAKNWIKDKAETVSNWVNDTVKEASDRWNSQDENVKELIGVGIGVAVLGVATAVLATVGAPAIAVAATVGAAVNLTTTYVSAKVTGQSYSLTDGIVAATAGGINAIPGAGPLLNGLTTGLYTGHSNYQKGASLDSAIVSGVVSGVCGALSIGNLANLGSNSLANVAATASADLVFGTGYNSIAAATSQVAVQKKSAKNRK